MEICVPPMIKLVFVVVVGRFVLNIMDEQTLIMAQSLVMLRRKEFIPFLIYYFRCFKYMNLYFK